MYEEGWKENTLVVFSSATWPYNSNIVDVTTCFFQLRSLPSLSQSVSDSWVLLHPCSPLRSFRQLQGASPGT